MDKVGLETVGPTFMVDSDACLCNCSFFHTLLICFLLAESYLKFSRASAPEVFGAMLVPVFISFLFL